MAWYSRFLSGSAYEGANFSRNRPPAAGQVTFAQDEDKAVTEWGRENLRLECRNLSRNSSIATGIGGRFCDNVVGDGIKPQAKTSDPAWNAAAEAYFNEWSKIADYRQRSTLWDLQRMAVLEGLSSGEMGFILINNGQLQPVEAERIRNPKDKLVNVIDGVRLTKEGIPLSFFIHNRNENGGFDGTDFKEISVSDFKHIARIKRPDQVRGVPEMAPAINAIKDLDRYIQATLLKAENEAKNFFTVENEGGAPRISQEARRYPGNTADQEGKPLEKVETGQIVYLRKGEKMNNVKNESPGSNFSPFTERIARIIGAAFGLPYEFVLLDFSMGSFSSSRAALLQTYRTFNNWQAWLINGFLQPVWNWRIAKAIKEGHLPPAPVDARGVSEWYRVQWQTPEFGWVDPQNEAQAHILEINAGAGTLTSWCRKKGKDAEDVLAEKARDIGTAIMRANELNAEYPGINITWRDLIMTSMPGQNTQAVADKPDDDDVRELSTTEAGNKWLT